MSGLKYLFICAHPDDLEFYISNIMITIAGIPKNEAKILSMTKGEYGTSLSSLNGEKLGKIRERELQKAAQIEGITHVEFCGFIDAHLEINPEVIQTVTKAIQGFDPDVIFTPEGFYPYYPHDDHIRTGLIVYSIVKKMENRNHPQLFMYHSYKNTHYFPMKHWRRQSKALLMHKSQYWLLLPMYPLRFIFGFYFGFRLSRQFRRYIMAEAVRRVEFKTDKAPKLTFRQRIFRLVVAKLKSLFKPMT